MALRNDATKDGKWVIGGKRRVVYVLNTLSAREQQQVAEVRVKRGDEYEVPRPRSTFGKRHFKYQAED